jgi:hypothetical protein
MAPCEVRREFIGSSMERREWARRMDGGWSAAVVVGAHDGRGCTGTEVNDTRVRIAMREVELGMVGPWSVRREHPFCRSCDTKNLRNIKFPTNLRHTDVSQVYNISRSLQKPAVKTIHTEHTIPIDLGCPDGYLFPSHFYCFPSHEPRKP